MPVIDLHCDTIDKIYKEQSSLYENKCHVDLVKLKKSNYFAQWFALFIDTQSLKEPPLVIAKKMYSYFMKELKANHSHIELATSFKEYTEIRKAHKIAAFLSLEEGQIIGGSIDQLQELCHMGVRMMTLTWNYENDLAAPHSSPKGLTDFGRQVVSYLNSSPILMDLSHLSEKAVQEAASLYKKPIIASHCNARGVYGHSRNLSDDTLRCIARSGGIVGLNLYSLFLDGTNHSTFHGLKAHIAHIYRVGGEDVLALGTDFDGMTCDLEVCDAGNMGKLMEALVKLYPQRVIDKLMYQNAERIIKENL